MFLDGVKNALQKFEHLQVVAECTDGDAVVKFISRHPVDVAVLDVNMPGKNGLVLAKLIGTEYPHTKTIFLTMYHPLAIGAENVYSSYSSGYVLKNSGSHILCEAIEAAFGGRVYMDPKLKDMAPGPMPEPLPFHIKISSREKEIIRLIIEGKSTRDMARQLYLSELTIQTHRKNIYNKLDVKNVAGLVQKVGQMGMDLG